MGRDLTLIIPVLLLAAGLAGCESEQYTFFDGLEGGPGGTNQIGGTSSSYNCDNIVPGQDFEDDMLCAHNKYRETPPSSEPIPEPPLDPLQWDNELADFAQAHADKCLDIHSAEEARPVGDDGRPAGETIYDSVVDHFSDWSVVEEWAIYGAYDYDYDSDFCPGGLCEEYQQIVWAETTHMGCGKATCDPLEGAISPGERDFWVCLYTPAANVPGQRPYTTQ